MLRSRHVSFALLWLLVFGTACTSYKQIQPTEVADYDKVQVTTKDGIKRLFIDPSLEPDSLRGYLNEQAVAIDETWAVPLDAVSEVKARQPDGLNTAGAVILVAAGALVVVGALALLTCDGGLFCN